MTSRRNGTEAAETERQREIRVWSQKARKQRTDAAELEARAMTIMRTAAVMHHEAAILLARAALLRQQSDG